MMIFKRALALAVSLIFLEIFLLSRGLIIGCFPTLAANWWRRRQERWSYGCWIWTASSNSGSLHSPAPVTGSLRPWPAIFCRAMNYLGCGWCSNDGRTIALDFFQRSFEFDDHFSLAFDLNSLQRRQRTPTSDSCFSSAQGSSLFGRTTEPGWYERSSWI